MLLLKKKTTKLLRGSFVIVLLVHICTSCSSKAQGFTFKDDEKEVLPELGPGNKQTDSNHRLEEVSADNFFEEKVEQSVSEENRRNGKELESVKPEASVEKGAPRFSRKITSPAKLSETDIGKMNYFIATIRISSRIIFG